MRRVFHTNFALAGLVVGTILLRVGLTYVLPRTIQHDEQDYLLLGYNWLTGRGFTVAFNPEVHFTPLYPLVSGALYFLVGDFEWASNLTYALFGGLLHLPIFVVARRVYGEQTAWVTCMLLAIFPALSVSVLYWGTMTEPLYLCLIYAGLAALLTGLESNRLSMFATAGALFGLAYLTRPEAVVYLFIFFIFGLIWLAQQGGLRTRRTWYALGWLALPFVLFAAPYVGYLHAHTGHWMLTGKLGVTYAWGKESSKGSDPIAHDQLMFGLETGGRDVMWSSPERFQQYPFNPAIIDLRLARRMLANARELVKQFFDRHVFWYGLLPLVFLALFNTPWDRRRLRYEAFLMSILVPLLAFLMFHIEVRLFAPAFPVLLMWTARGALDLGTWLRGTRELCRGSRLSGGWLHGTAAWLPAGLLGLFLVTMMPSVAMAWRSHTFFGFKEAGLWLREHAPAKATVMARGAAPALYANGHYVPSPRTEWSRFLQWARTHAVDYWVEDAQALTRLRPWLAFLLEVGTPELELVWTFQERERQTLIWHILPSPERQAR